MLLRLVDADLAVWLRALLASGDDYAGAAKPVIDWDDKAAREVLVDSRAWDGYALLAALDGQRLPDAVGQAARLLATVLGQDLETGSDGVLRIARKVAPDRVISTVDPQARHGHKTNHRGFDGYKGHIAIDPDAEIVTATAVTAGNVGDIEPVGDLLADVLDAPASPQEQPAATVYGDAAYGAGDVLQRLHPPPGPPRPKWKGRSPPSGAAATAAAAPACGDEPESPPTSTCSPPRSTWPGWPPSARYTPSPDGKPHRHNPRHSPTTWPTADPARPANPPPKAPTRRNKQHQPGGPTSTVSHQLPRACPADLAGPAPGP